MGLLLISGGPRGPGVPPQWGKGPTVDVSLVMVKADGTSKEVVLQHSGSVIGRDEGCRIRVPIASISRKHCELTWDEDELKVKDLGSSNGTFVNGKRVRTAELAPGDLLAVGPVVFVVRIDGHPKEIDAKDAHAAGVIGEDDDGEGAKGAGARPPTIAMVPPKTGTMSMPPAAKSDDDDDFGDLLKGLDLDDDDDDAPPKKK